MKTASDVKRARMLLETFDQAKEWAETFDQAKGREYEKALFQEIAMRAEADRPDGSASIHGYRGELSMPRDLAGEMMNWLRSRAAEELEKVGVKVRRPARRGEE